MVQPALRLSPRDSLRVIYDVHDARSLYTRAGTTNLRVIYDVHDERPTSHARIGTTDRSTEDHRSQTRSYRGAAASPILPVRSGSEGEAL